MLRTYKSPMSKSGQQPLILLPPQVIVEFAGEALNVKYVNLSAMTLLVYHSALNIDAEVKYIWASKWSFSKCLYIMTKYLAFCDGAMNLIYLFNTNFRPSTCSILYSSIIYSILLGVVIAESILLVRTWIAWGLSRIVFWYMIFVLVAATSLSLFIIHYHEHGPLQWISHVEADIPKIRNCFLYNTGGIEEQYLSFVCLIVVELNVLLLTIWNMKRNSLWWRNRDTAPLIYAFHRDSLLYLVCILCISCVNVAFFKYEANTFYNDIMMEPQRIVHGVLSAQLILNARKYARNLTYDLSDGSGETLLELDTLSLSFEAMNVSGIEGVEEAIRLDEI
ncbi:hypothetical protein SCHPADRAFT_1001425 [Schizopora paradoxa]|uniref:DUF6533 domain-containing protein n=1 Tax=Schizopora paradoxa TaxID=27342 RepID=A0A0H2R8R3_9AGAM|nr:hypothetical protein SCHPADRAFT_1001425 [Schizopora paradoxa]